MTKGNSYILDSELYSKFKAQHQSKSGVSYKVAITQSGLDLKAFQKPSREGRITGEVICKIWTQSKVGSLLWIYLRSDDNELLTFPVFRTYNGNKKIVERFSLLPLGGDVSVEFKRAKPSSKIYLTEVEESETKIG